MSKAKEAVETLLRTLDDIRKTFEYNRDAIKLKEQETQDLLHEIELGNLDAVQRIQVFNQLREVRQERRRMKDENEALEPLYTVLNQRGLEHIRTDLIKTRAGILKILKNQSERKYNPRIRNDLTIGGGG